MALSTAPDVVYYPPKAYSQGLTLLSQCCLGGSPCKWFLPGHNPQRPSEPTQDPAPWKPFQTAISLHAHPARGCSWTVCHGMNLLFAARSQGHLEP